MKLIPVPLNEGRSPGLAKRLVEELTQFRDISNKIGEIPFRRSKEQNGTMSEKRRAEKAQLRTMEMAESKKIIARIALQKTCSRLLNDYEGEHSLMQDWYTSEEHGSKCFWLALAAEPLADSKWTISEL